MIYMYNYVAMAIGIECLKRSFKMVDAILKVPLGMPSLSRRYKGLYCNINIVIDKQSGANRICSTVLGRERIGIVKEGIMKEI